MTSSGTPPPFDTTPLGRELAATVAAGVDERVAVVVTRVIEHVWSGRLDADSILQAAKMLESGAFFRHVVSIADAALSRGLAGPDTERLYCQALIEQGALHAAEIELSTMLEDPEYTPTVRGEVLGLLGRVAKQRYVHGRGPADLIAAIGSYRAGYELGTDRAWHGINLLALVHLARRDGVEGMGATADVDALAGDLLDLARAAPADLRDPWLAATEVEVLVAMDRLDEATAATNALADMVGGFVVQSLRRQLVEVWDIDATSPLMAAIDNRILASGSQAELDLPDNADALEKVFGTARALSYHNLEMGLVCAASVGRITDVAGESWGTCFLLPGHFIHDDLGDALLLATNAHVVSASEGVGVLVPGAAEARFDVTEDTDGNPLAFTRLTQIWTSPPTRCDVTLLRFEGPEPRLPGRFEPAGVLPPVTPGAYVTVVGHPGGGGLKLSIRGNDLIAYDTEQVKAHYKAPTEPGSSGSPVFNKDWQLIAVHHAGSDRLPRVDGITGFYEANEGITLPAIRAEYAATR